MGILRYINSQSKKKLNIINLLFTKKKALDNVNLLQRVRIC